MRVLLTHKQLLNPLASLNQRNRDPQGPGIPINFSQTEQKRDVSSEVCWRAYFITRSSFNRHFSHKALIHRGKFSSFTFLGQKWCSALVGASLEFYEISLRAYFSWLPHLVILCIMETHRAWYCTYLLFLHIYCFSMQLFTTELQGMATLIILQESFFPDMSHSSPLCCVQERALIAHKFLIKKNTEANQSDVLPVLLFMWQHLQCLFINSLICSTECCWSSFSFFFPSFWLSVKTSGMALPSGSHRPSWILGGQWMAGPLSVVWWGLHQSPVPEGAGLGTDRHLGTPYLLVLPKALGSARAPQPCRGRLLPRIIWAFSKLFSLHILDTMNVHTQNLAIALGFQSRLFVQSLPQPRHFSSWP